MSKVLKARADKCSVLIVAVDTVQERPTTKEVVTYVQENRPVAKQVIIHFHPLLLIYLQL